MTDKKKTIHEEIQALSKALAGGISIDAKAGTASASVDLYKDNMPEGLTMEAVKLVSEYNTNFIAAGAHAFGEASTKAMVENKNLQALALQVPMGVKDSINYSYLREKTTPDRFHGGAPITKHGVLEKPEYRVKAGENGGQLKIVRATIMEMAAKALAE